MATGWACPQGCSTLWDDEKSEQIVDAGEGGAVAVLAERAGAVGLEDVEGETAQAGEHAGIGADARAVFAEGDVAAVVGGGLDPPMRAHRLGGAGGGERGIRDVEGGLGGEAQQPGPASRVKTSRSTRMTAATWECQSVSASLSAGSKTLTVRVSSRLRPLLRLLTDRAAPSVAAISWICWCRVGWLSLAWTISAMLASAATSKCFFGSAAHRA